jgi:hypothetical protein
MRHHWVFYCRHPNPCSILLPDSCIGSNFAVEEPYLPALRAAHGSFSGNGRPADWVAADIVRIEGGKLAEHRDVAQDEATKAQSVSGPPMFGDRFPD